MRVALALTGWLAFSVSMSAEDRSVHVYTNDDLTRVSGSRAQTGGDSQPAATVGAVDARHVLNRSSHGETYWRREAERLRARIAQQRDAMEDLRASIEQRRRRTATRPYSDPQLEAAQRRLESLERRIRDQEDAFEDRARREGALPGWLR